MATSTCAEQAEDEEPAAAEEGPDAVTSRALTQQLGLTNGSFRHHSGSTTAFDDALAAHWEQAQAAQISRWRSTGGIQPFEPDPIARAVVEWARRIRGIAAEIDAASGNATLKLGPR